MRLDAREQVGLRTTRSYRVAKAKERQSQQFVRIKVSKNRSRAGLFLGEALASSKSAFNMSFNPSLRDGPL
jgi:hypothetical protein